MAHFAQNFWLLLCSWRFCGVTTDSLDSQLPKSNSFWIFMRGTTHHSAGSKKQKSSLTKSEEAGE